LNQQSVSLTIPCVTRPYTNVTYTLTPLANRIWVTSNASDPYPGQPTNDETQFSRDFVAML
jgi:Tc toxin complex TcA C-terminal TcB-binding domain